MLEELLFQLGYLCLGCLGTGQAVRAIHKLRVLICSPFWPRAKAKLRESRVAYEVTESARFGASELLDYTYYHDVQEGFWFTKLVTRWHYPLLRFEYSHQGKTITTDNLASYNRKAFYFNENHAKAIVDQYQRRRIFGIRYNPQRLSEVFLGARHFPYFCTMLQAIAGWFFALTFSLTSEFSLEHLGIVEPTLTGRPISIFVITGLLVGYGVLRIAIGLIKASQYQQ